MIYYPYCDFYFLNLDFLKLKYSYTASPSPPFIFPVCFLLPLKFITAYSLILNVIHTHTHVNTHKHTKEHFNKTWWVCLGLMYICVSRADHLVLGVHPWRRPISVSPLSLIANISSFRGGVPGDLSHPPWHISWPCLCWGLVKAASMFYGCGFPVTARRQDPAADFLLLWLLCSFCSLFRDVCHQMSQFSTSFQFYWFFFFCRI